MSGLVDPANIDTSTTCRHLTGAVRQALRCVPAVGRGTGGLGTWLWVHWFIDIRPHMQPGTESGASASSAARPARQHQTDAPDIESSRQSQLSRSWQCLVQMSVLVWPGQVKCCLAEFHVRPTNFFFLQLCTTNLTSSRPTKLLMSRFRRCMRTGFRPSLTVVTHI